MSAEPGRTLEDAVQAFRNDCATEGAVLLPGLPASELEVLWPGGCMPAELARLYASMNGTKEGGAPDSLIEVWALERVVSELGLDEESRRLGLVSFADWAIDCWRYSWSSRGEGFPAGSVGSLELGKVVAGSLAEFFHLLRVDPDRLF